MPSWTSIDADKQPRRPGYWTDCILSGAFFGLLVGILIRFASGIITRSHLGAHSGEMTIAFVVLGPMVVGFFSCYPGARRGELTLWTVLGLSCIAMLATCIVSALFLLEGAICIVMLLPAGVLLSFLGGCVAYLVGRRLPYPPATLGCMAALPLVLAWFEAQHTALPTTRTVENQVSIHAGPADVWHQIQSVPPIAPTELKSTWAHTIGFPRPVAAILSHPGVGGVRTATFERGLTFYETITDWQPSRQLAFSIKADTAHIPPTTLDEHVTIGGPYFDVLDGAYRIEPRADGTVLLHLISHQRLSTDFNGYAGLWSDAVMSNLQQSILQVIQHRCESAQQIALRNTNQ